MATALARDGLGVVVLEASERFQDRVRGESLMPWGVAEARELGVEQALLDAGAHVTPVVRADGRHSSVRRQAGIDLEHQREVHMITGLLLDDVGPLPHDHDFLASEEDPFMASFQQGGGRIRVYLCPGTAEKHRFSGPGGVEDP